MVSALSSSMARSLAALMDINDQMETTQKRVSTGKAVSDPSDNIAIYFKARSYTDRADLYDTVNSGITQAVANLDFVDKALSNMIDNVKGARNMLTDAKSKAVAASSAVNITGKTSYLATTYTPPTAGAVARIVKGQIVDSMTGPNAYGKVNDGSMFQNGDIFQVTFRDSSNNTNVTRYFKATAPDATALPDQSKRGDTSANAIEFSDLNTLAGALNIGFGRANANFDLMTNDNGVSYQLRMQLNSNTQSITFGQTTDASVTVGGAATTGASFDFTRLLQGAGSGASVNNGNSLDATNAQNAGSWTYSPTGGTQTDQTAVDARKQAADFFRQTVYGLVSTVRDAALPGFANLLKGEAMTVALNDTNTVSQTVKLSTPIDFTAPNTGTSNPFGMAFTITASGAISTGYTDTNNPTTSNFLDDGILNQTLSKLDQVSTMLGQQRTLIGASKTAMQSRLDLNKTLVASLKDSANAMTAADMAEETANLASLQNRQNFAATNLSVTRQSEQFLLNLIR